MIKHLTPILILLAVTACEEPPQCGAGEGDLQDLNLNGQVEFMAEYLYSRREGRLVRTERRNELTFDICGKIVEENSYEPDGTPLYTKYYRYNRDRKRTQVEFHRNGTMYYRDFFWYDEQGNLTSEARYDLGGNVEDRKFYYRDRNGQPVQIREYSSGRLIAEYMYDYRDGGKRVEWIYDYSYDGKRWLRSTAISDREGNILEHYDNDYIVADYDRGNIVKQVRYSDPMMSDPEREFMYDYEYDAAGNWILRVAHTAEGDTVSIREREIKYAYNLFADTRK